MLKDTLKSYVDEIIHDDITDSVQPIIIKKLYQL